MTDWSYRRGQVHTCLAAMLLLASVFFVRSQGAAVGGGNLGTIRIAAERGLPRSQFKLGNHYAAEGEETLAAIWYRRAAERGHAEAQLALARCYRLGLGVEQNLEEADRWSTLAQAQLGMGNLARTLPLGGETPGGLTPDVDPVVRVGDLIHPLNPVIEPVEPREAIGALRLGEAKGTRPSPAAASSGAAVVPVVVPVMAEVEAPVALEPGGEAAMEADEVLADEIVAGLMRAGRARVRALEVPGLVLEQLAPVLVAYDPPPGIAGKDLASTRDSEQRK